MKTRFGILAIIMVNLIACKSTALVTCNNIDKFESRSGTINTPFLDLGDIIILDTMNKTGLYFGHINIIEDQLNTTEPRDTFEIISKTDFSINFTGKIARSENASLSAKNAINNSSTFFLLNSMRKTMIYPVNFINESDLKQSLLLTMGNEPHSVVLLVTGMIYGKEIKLRLSRERSISVDADVAKIGTLKVEVLYNCNDALKAVSTAPNGAGMLFKSTFFVPNENLSEFTFLNKGISLGEYDLMNTFSR